MQEMYVVVSSPLADIGKGWITASIAKSLNPIGVPIKIDPALVMIKDFSPASNIDINSICSDTQYYASLGLPVSSGCVIRSGEVLVDFITRNSLTANEFHPNSVKRLTFADASLFLAEKLTHLIKQNDYKKVIFEIGGNVHDHEHQYIANALRFTAINFNIEPKLVVLTYLDNSDDPKHFFKKNLVIQAIEQSREMYWEPWLILFRNRAKKVHLISDTLNKILEQIAVRAIISQNKLIFVPEFESLEQLSKFIQQLKQFEKPPQAESLELNELNPPSLTQIQAC